MCPLSSGHGTIASVSCALVAVCAMAAFGQTVAPPAVRGAADGASASKQTEAAKTDLYGDALPEWAISRLGTVRFRPADGEQIGVPVLSADGTALMAFGGDGLIYQWDARTGSVVHREESPLPRRVMCTLSDDGRLGASYERSGAGWLVRVVDVRTGKEMYRIPEREGDLSALSMRFGLRGRELYVGHHHHLSLYSFRAGNAVATRLESDGPTAYAPRKSLVARFRTKTEIALWDFESVIPKGSFAPAVPAGCEPATITLSESGRLLAIAWQPTAEAEFKGLPGPPAMEHNRIDVFETMTFARVFRSGGLPAPAFACLFSSDETSLAAGTKEATYVMRLDGAGRPLVASVAGARPTAFSLDGRILYLNTSYCIDAWDIAAGKPLFESPTGRIHAVAMNRDGSVLATSDGGGYLRVWNTNTGRQTLSIRPGHPVGVIAISPSGRQIAGVWGETHAVRVLDASTGVETKRLPFDSRVTRLAYSANGSILVCVGMTAARTFAAENGWATTEIGARGMSVSAVAVASEPPVVAVVGQDARSILLWSAVGSMPARQITVPWGALTAVGLSADGKYVAAAARGVAAAVWDARTGEQRLRTDLGGRWMSPLLFLGTSPLVLLAGSGAVGQLGAETSMWSAPGGGPKRVVAYVYPRAISSDSARAALSAPESVSLLVVDPRKLPGWAAVGGP